MEKVIKYFSKAPEKKDDRVLRFVGSDESLDRDNEKIIRLRHIRGTRNLVRQ